LNKDHNKKPFLLNPETVQLEKPAETSNQNLPKQEGSPQNFRAFFKTNASNYLVTLTLATASMTLILFFQNVDNIVRAFSGLLLALALPGYALMNVLFPPMTLSLEKKNGVGWLFTGGLSVVMSIIVVSMVAFALDLTPIGVTLVSLNLSLFILTIVFGTVGLWRRYIKSKNSA